MTFNDLTPMIGNMQTIDYVQNALPDMLGALPPDAAAEYDGFAKRVVYTCTLNQGKPPRFHKGKYGKKYDRWTCGNCGAGILHPEIQKFCMNCGCAIREYDRSQEREQTNET